MDKGNAISRLFHKLCTKCTSLTTYALVIVDDLRRLENAEDELNDDCRVAMTRDIVKMIDWRFHIYCNTNKCHDLLWVAMAKEIISQSYAHFDELKRCMLSFIIKNSRDDGNGTREWTF